MAPVAAAAAAAAAATAGCFLQVMLFATYVAMSHASTDGLSRQSRSVSLNSGPLSAPEIYSSIETALAEIRSVHGLSNVSQIETKLGTIGVYVDEKLRLVSRVLTDAPREVGGGLTNDLKVKVIDFLQVIETLGYIYSTGMIPGESRRLDIAERIHMSIRRTDLSAGSLVEYTGSGSVTIPSSSTYAPTADHVTVVSYSLIGARDLLTDSSSTNQTLGSSLLSLSVFDESGAIVKVTSNSEPIRIELLLDDVVPDTLAPACSFLSYNEGAFSEWSSEGCTTVLPAVSYGKVECRCTHLTTFALLLSPTVAPPPLNLVTWVGCAVTTLACAVAAMLIIGYRLLKSIRSYLRMSFLMMLGMAEMIFLTGIRWTNVPALCTMVTLALHYFFLASATWLLNYTLFLGNEISGQSEESLDLLHYSVIGWLVPSVVVLITFIWKHPVYTHADYCWISQTDSLSLSYQLPLVFVFTANLCVLLYVVSCYFAINDPKRKLMLKFTASGIRSCCLLLPSLAATSLLADFTIKHQSLALQISFSLCNITLGINVFLFMCYFNEEVRQVYFAHRGRKARNKKSTSDIEHVSQRSRPLPHLSHAQLGMKIWAVSKQASSASSEAAAAANISTVSSEWETGGFHRPEPVSVNHGQSPNTGQTSVAVSSPLKEFPGLRDSTTLL